MNQQAIVLALGIAMGLIGQDNLASAQTVSGKSNAVTSQGADPSVTTSVYMDWTLRCVKLTTQAGSKACELIQSTTVSGQQTPIAQVALGKISVADPLQLTLLMPNNVTLTTMPTLSMAPNQAPLSLVWQKCLPGGCFATAIADAASLAQWKKSAAIGKISLMDGLGSAVTLPFSGKGLSDALEALVKSN